VAQEIFIDAGFWIALFNRRDEHYDEARTTWRQVIRARWSAITTNWTLYEALTYFNCRLGRYDIAVAALDLVSTSSVIIRVEETLLENRSLEIFYRNADKRWSVFDCANFACIEQHQCQYALSYDRNFVQAQLEFNFPVFRP
jgi:predicted nucleic acid-binding protein